MANVLIIDDDKLVCDSISNVVKSLGHSTSQAFNLQDGLTKACSGAFDVVFLDVHMPDGSGLDILPDIQKTASLPEVIIITGFGDPDGAELAIKNGAWDYIEKPLSIRQMRLPFTRALQYREEKRKFKTSVALKREGIIGKSPQIIACLDILTQAANSEANVLLTGETGTGKELFAWTIHNNSSRADRNFVVVDCAALPETLVESVLFGHIKGAFTGADRSKDGLIKQADKGTLFLDEVGELPVSIQKSFLRVLQERRFRPVGGNKELSSNFRLITATNRNLDSMVKQGKFREDLLFRLRTLAINLPALRDIREDIKELVLYYMNTLCAKYGKDMKGFSPEFWDVLIEYDWPGNVRELIQALERAIIAAQDEPTLFPKHLPNYIRIKVVRESLNQKMAVKGRSIKNSGSLKSLPQIQDIRERAISEAEKKYLVDLISITGKDIKEACKISGLSRSRLYTLMKKYNILSAH
jgi:two-component system NtrC family response regulator